MYVCLVNKSHISASNLWSKIRSCTTHRGDNWAEKERSSNAYISVLSTQFIWPFPSWTFVCSIGFMVRIWIAPWQVIAFQLTRIWPQNISTLTKVAVVVIVDVWKRGWFGWQYMLKRSAESFESFCSSSFHHRLRYFRWWARRLSTQTWQWFQQAIADCLLQN